MRGVIYNTQIASPAGSYRTWTMQLNGPVITFKKSSYHMKACNHISTHVYCHIHVWHGPRSITNRVLLEFCYDLSKY